MHPKLLVTVTGRLCRSVELIQRVTVTDSQVSVELIEMVQYFSLLEYLVNNLWSGQNLGTSAIFRLAEHLDNTLCA